MTEKFKFVDRNDGLCCVYYRKGRALYCIQDDGSWGQRNLVFYRCSRDGEPSYRVEFPGKSQFDRYEEPKGCGG